MTASPAMQQTRPAELNDPRAGLVLGIETSCDDTSVAVLERGSILRAMITASQDHALYGGVVPELASRAHLERLPRLVERVLDDAGVAPRHLTAIAVTRAPGLVGSLVVGVAFARAYGFGLGIPVVGVNHIEAHLHSASLEHGEAELPALALVVSGGHTELVTIEAFGRYRWLGATLDDAAGEAFDKVAKLLGLGFPGGPAIDRLAATGDAEAVAFPRPMLDRPGFDFSYSGLKTAVSTAVGGEVLTERRRADLAASFQRAMVDTLVGRTVRALEHTGARTLQLGGGVACNRELRQRLAEVCAGRSVALRIPSPRFCADNAAMVARVGALRLERGDQPEPELDVAASLEESGLLVENP
jgi:N6-L-threonylcarbamoyladenine synthase